MQSWQSATEKAGCVKKGKEKAPLVQRGDRPSQTVRGDCKTGQTHSTWFYNPARQRSLGAAARRSPPCAKGGQTVADGQGGLTAASVVNDTSRRVWASSARCPQSLSRRSPTAPFAQGSRLCCSTYNRPPRVDNKKLPRWGSFFAFHLVLLSSAEAVPCRDGQTFFARLHPTILVLLSSAEAQYVRGVTPLA